jgi:hypothetical protein
VKKTMALLFNQPGGINQWSARKSIYVAVAVLVIVFFAGCAAQKTTTTSVRRTAPTLPTNARDAADANVFRVIADAYAFLNSVRKSQITMTASQKTDMADFYGTKVESSNG